MAMLESINKIADEFDIVHQCSVEESMACGIGVCMTCVVPMKLNNEIKMIRTWIDRPSNGWFGDYLGS
jgi:dihydroorotate dehydrogenase electron transfer subunit